MIDIGNSILFFSMLMSGVTGMKADYSKDYITSLDYHSSTPVAASTSEELKLIVYDVKNKSTNLIVTYYSSYPSTESSSKKPSYSSNYYYSFDMSNANSTQKFSRNFVYPNYEDKQHYELSSICITRCSENNIIHQGSAFAVSDRSVLSAAHCFYSNGKFFSNPLIGILQQKKNNEFYCSFNVSKIIILYSYYINGNQDDDWCYCIVDDYLDEKDKKTHELSYYTGYLSIAAGYTLADVNNYACGYLGNLQKDDPNYLQLAYSSARGVKNYNTALYELYNYAIGGMSGGPLLFQYEDSMTLETYFGVAGIVAYTNILDNHGYAVKITNATIAALRSTKNYE